ncbi:nuclear transport factor 2 family protein [Acidobacterium sp. S8]|uniref:nuclear transport factor 2 family protein n=1 Tax=Acidobacterium sp. S8 TaxID=1641854 RepID=UPI00131D5321|nr:nuclear transport factor 2 family protein [Acidobacterium sp. S8]
MTRFPLFLIVLCAPAALLSAQSSVAVTPATANASQSVEIKEMQKLEDQWSDAIVKRDQYGLELLLSPLYVGISAGGEVTTRNQQIAQLFQKTTDPLTMEQRVISARMLGDVAVVNGTYITRRKTGSDTIEERGIFTHVYQRVRSNWLCINSQRTIVAEESPSKQKAAKKSNAELPFHVPFISKGSDSTKQPPAQTDTQANPQPPQ